MTITTDVGAAVAVAGGAETLWWTGCRATIRAAREDTAGELAVLEIEAPAGLEIPLHVHHREDETFVILEGGATFTVGEATVEARPGDVLFGPRGVPHRYTVGPAGIRMLFVFTPGGFEGFVRETGEPALALGPPDAFRVPDTFDAACAAYGVELLAAPAGA